MGMPYKAAKPKELRQLIEGCQHGRIDCDDFSSLKFASDHYHLSVGDYVYCHLGRPDCLILLKVIHSDPDEFKVENMHNGMRWWSSIGSDGYLTHSKREKIRLVKGSGKFQEFLLTDEPTADTIQNTLRRKWGGGVTVIEYKPRSRKGTIRKDGDTLPISVEECVLSVG